MIRCFFNCCFLTAVIFVFVKKSTTMLRSIHESVLSLSTFKLPFIELILHSLQIQFFLNEIELHCKCMFSSQGNFNDCLWKLLFRMENVVHKYSRAGVYTVTIECSTSKWHVAAYRSITIQEPLGEFGTIKCHSMNQSTDYSNCKALYNNPLRIQVTLHAGKYKRLLILLL